MKIMHDYCYFCIFLLLFYYVAKLIIFEVFRHIHYYVNIK